MDPSGQPSSNTPTPGVSYQPPLSDSNFPPNPQGEDPGKTLAIIGLVLAFVCQIIGLTLSIVAYKKSKAAGFSTTLANVAIILNSVILGIALIVVGIIALITLTAFNGIQERTKSASGATTANAIVKKAEIYNINTGSYPTSLSDFGESSDSALSPDDSAAISSKPITGETDKVTVYTCGKDGVRVDYWNASTDAAASETSLDVTSNSACTIMR